MQTLGQSDLGSFLQCPRKFFYRHKMGLIPRAGNAAMSMGTLFHAGCAFGYNALKTSTDQDWLKYALAATATLKVDRDGVPLDLDEDKRANVADMLTYYWEHVGQHDHFDEILAVESPLLMQIPGHPYLIRGTADLVVREGGEVYIYDHKTSANIDEDQGHLALDGQTHVYYLQAWAQWQRPMAFVHNFVRRFEEKDKTIVGPPSFLRTDGKTPYAKTASGKARTASDDPNDYVRRVRTPLSERQLRGYLSELDARAKLMEFCESTNTWPRVDTKMGYGCGSCAYYAPCTRELDGGELDPARLKMLFTSEEELRAQAG